MTTMVARTTASARRAWRLIAIAGAAATAFALLPQASAAAQEPPFDRPIEGACTEEARSAAVFADVSPQDTHAQAIACLSVYGVASGQFVDGDSVFLGGDSVTREQMASFVARAIDEVPNSVYQLPDDPGTALFEDADDISDAHIAAVNRLAEADIIGGLEDGTFAPSEPVNRAQMATFIAGAIEAVTGEQIERSAVFTDISGTHEANIEKLATLGVTAGVGDGRYAPGNDITRGQMASFIARTMDHLVAEGLLFALDFAAGDAEARLGLVGVDTDAGEDADVVTLTLDHLEGSEGDAGWRIRYVDEALAFGTGDPIEVEGNAMLQVILEGMALPPEFPEDVEEAITDLINTQLDVDGEWVTDVAVSTTFEGQHQVVIGTTGYHPFVVERGQDPQTVEIAVGETATGVSLTVEPECAEIGGSFTATATGLEPGEQYAILIDPRPADGFEGGAPGTADADGVLEVPGSLTADGIQAGDYTLEVSDGSGQGLAAIPWEIAESC